MELRPSVIANGRCEIVVDFTKMIVNSTINRCRFDNHPLAISLTFLDPTP
jgi:hypothetical protein